MLTGTGNSDGRISQPAEAGGAREVGGGSTAAHARRSLAGALARRLRCEELKNAHIASRKRSPFTAWSGLWARRCTRWQRETNGPCLSTGSGRAAVLL